MAQSSKAAEQATPASIDAEFTSSEYAAMLEEVSNYLPAFLSTAATEHHDPVGDLSELLRLTPGDLDRLVAVHTCLSEPVRRFVEHLDAGLRRPVTSTERPEELTQAVRGPIDWGSTIRRRTASGFDPSLFVVRPGARIFDTPENRALAWLIRALSLQASLARKALRDLDPLADAHDWVRRIQQIEGCLHRARRTEWLRAIPAVRPTPRDRQRVAASRLRFYRKDLAEALGALIDSDRRDEHFLTDVLCRRYFRPSKAWKLFEVVVALRLARELAKPIYATSTRRTRLLAGSGEAGPYARYVLEDGSSVALTYQGWPAAARKAPSERAATGSRHGFKLTASIPDIFITRTSGHGELIDAVLLELKASKSPGTLSDGLSQLLGYLADRADAFHLQPSGWLVAPPGAFAAADPDPSHRLWAVNAAEVAQWAAERMTAPV